MTKLRSGSTYSTDGPECPHCGRQFTPDDSYYYDADNYTKQDCDDCGKQFSVEVHHSVSWSCEVIPDAVSTQKESP